MKSFKQECLVIASTEVTNLWKDQTSESQKGCRLEFNNTEQQRVALVSLARNRKYVKDNLLPIPSFFDGQILFGQTPSLSLSTLLLSHIHQH